MSEMVGVPRLGFQNDSNFGEYVLGDEFEVIDGEPDQTQEYILTQSERRVRVRLVKNVSGATLVPGQAVKRAVGATDSPEKHVTAVGAAGEVACGIADPRINGSIAINSKFLMIVKGPTDAIASGALTKGNSANVDAAGRVANGSNVAADAFGVCLEDAAAAGDVVRVDVDFRAVGN